MGLERVFNWLESRRLVKLEVDFKSSTTIKVDFTSQARLFI